MISGWLRGNVHLGTNDHCIKAYMPLNSMFTPSRHLPGKQISDLKLNSCQLHLRLDLAVRVVDDGKEHVEEDEEDNKDVEDEEHGADDRMGSLKG